MTLALIIAGAYVGVLLAAIAWRAVAWAVRIALDLFSRKSTPTADSPTTPHVVVTLVHGTFARRADWTTESSPLCRTIRTTMHEPVRFEQFLWSGWNTVTSRNKAVERLISHLADVQTRWPQARHFVVGHSHGGNIALYVNHACRPNCYSQIQGHTIWIRAGRSIKAGEELTYDYHTDGDKIIQCRCRKGCTRWL